MPALTRLGLRVERSHAELNVTRAHFGVQTVETHSTRFWRYSARVALGRERVRAATDSLILPQQTHSKTKENFFKGRFRGFSARGKMRNPCFLARERTYERWRRGGVRGAKRERHSENLMG